MNSQRRGVGGGRIRREGAHEAAQGRVLGLQHLRVLRQVAELLRTAGIERGRRRRERRGKSGGQVRQYAFRGWASSHNRRDFVEPPALLQAQGCRNRAPPARVQLGIKSVCSCASLACQASERPPGCEAAGRPALALPLAAPPPQVPAAVGWEALLSKRSHTNAHAHVNACLHQYTHVRAHTHTHTHTRARAHTHL